MEVRGTAVRATPLFVRQRHPDFVSDWLAALGPEAREVIEAVKVVQDHLGDLNDAHVAEGILREFAADYEQRQVGVQIAQRRSIDRVIQYMADRAAEKHRLMVTFPEAWAHFTRAEVRRALAAAVAIL